jgi:hypothetical protein
MTTKAQALATIVDLTRTHQISLADITSALGRPEIEANKKDALTLTRLFSYLGGIFILAGLSAFITLNWDYLNTAARILVTLGPGIICLILAVVMTTQKNNNKNIPVLIILSALLQPTGLFVTISQFATGGGDPRLAALVVFGTMALQYGLIFLKIKRTSLLFFTIYFGFSAFATLCSLLHISYDFAEFVCGGSLLALSYGIQRTPYNSICGFGYFLSSILLLWLGFDLLTRTPFEVLYLGIACFMLYVSTLVNSRSVLVTSTIAILSYISYFTHEHFLDSMGWPMCLILLGFIFFGVSNLALRLNKKLI